MVETSQPKPSQLSQRSRELLATYAIKAKAAGVSADQFLRFARAGIILNEKQLAAAAACRMADATNGPVEIGYGGARGGGKSFFGLAQMGVDDCQRVAGLKCLMLRKSGKSNIENLNSLRLQVLHSVPHTFSSYRGTIYFPNGSYIRAGHFQKESDIDDYLGLEYDIIDVEEATTLSKSKYTDVRTCNRTSKQNWRPRMYSNCNPGGIGHAWYKARFITPYQTSSQTETRFIPALVTDNPYNNKEYVSVLDSQVGWKLRAWRHGDWEIAAGQYFTNFRRDIHGTDIFDEARAVEWFCSLDYGFNHYTAVYLGAIDTDGDWHIVDEHCERGWLPERHVPAIEAMLGRHRVRGEGTEPVTLAHLRTFVAGADVFAKQRDGKTVAQDYKDRGIDLIPAYMDRVNGWGELLRLLGDWDANIIPHLWINPRCVRLLDCLPELQHDPHRPEDVLKVDVDEDGNGGDDPGDSLRYLVATRGRAVRQGKVGGI